MMNERKESPPNELVIVFRVDKILFSGEKLKEPSKSRREPAESGFDALNILDSYLLDHSTALGKQTNNFNDGVDIMDTNANGSASENGSNGSYGSDGSNDSHNAGDDDGVRSVLRERKQLEYRRSFRKISITYQMFDSAKYTGFDGSRDLHHRTLHGNNLSFLDATYAKPLCPLLCIAKVEHRESFEKEQTGEGDSVIIKTNYFRLIHLVGVITRKMDQKIVENILTETLMRTKRSAEQTMKSYPDEFRDGIEFKDLVIYIKQVGEQFKIDALAHCKKYNVLFYSFINNQNPLQLLQFAFPQNWSTLQEMEKSSPLRFTMLINEMKKNIASFFFHEVCEQFGLSHPLDPLVYRTWFLRYEEELPPSYPRADLLTVIYQIIQFYYDIKRHLKYKGNTCFLLEDLPDMLWKNDKYIVRKNGEQMDFKHIGEHPYFQYLVKIGVIIPDTESTSLSVAYRTYKYHFIRKSLLASLDKLVNNFDSVALSPQAKVQNTLNDLQKAAVLLPQQTPLGIVTGGPGNGKTTVIENYIQAYGSERVVTTTVVGSMVKSLRNRGIPATTSAMLISRRFPDCLVSFNPQMDTIADPLNSNTTDPVLKTAIQSIKTFYDAIELMVIDEASNQDDQTLAALLLCFPNLKSVIMVLDPNQIHPIGQGNFALDLLQFLKKKKFPMVTLETNFRMKGAKNSEEILAFDQAIMTGHLRELRIRTFENPGNFTDGGVYMTDYRNKDDLKKELLVIYKSLRSLSSTKKVKILNFTNNDVDLSNAVIDTYHKAQKKVPSTAKFYENQQLTIVANYPRKHAMLGPLNSYSDAVVNGDEFTLHNIRYLDRKNRNWIKAKQCNHATKEQLAPKNKDEFVFLFAKLPPGSPGSEAEHKFCVNPGFVQIADIKSAWATTANKSQGTEYDHTILVLPSPNEMTSPQLKFAVANHLHVGLTRSSDTLIILGSQTSLEILTSRRQNERLTFMLDDLVDFVSKPMEARIKPRPYYGATIQSLDPYLIEPAAFRVAMQNIKLSPVIASNMSREVGSGTNVAPGKAPNVQSAVIGRQIDDDEEDDSSSEHLSQEASDSESDDSSSSSESESDDSVHSKKTKTNTKKSYKSDTKDSRKQRKTKASMKSQVIIDEEPSTNNNDDDIVVDETTPRLHIAPKKKTEKRKREDSSDDDQDDKVKAQKQVKKKQKL